MFPAAASLYVICFLSPPACNEIMKYLTRGEKTVLKKKSSYGWRMSSTHAGLQRSIMSFSFALVWDDLMKEGLLQFTALLFQPM